MTTLPTMTQARYIARKNLVNGCVGVNMRILRADGREAKVYFYLNEECELRMSYGWVEA
jgi:hypothetical protein